MAMSGYESYESKPQVPDTTSHVVMTQMIHGAVSFTYKTGLFFGVNVGKSSFIVDFSVKNMWFSIAMLNYQIVPAMWS